MPSCFLLHTRFAVSIAVVRPQTQFCDNPMQPGATLSADRPEGNGTGIVWDDAGHIVTNYHVLGGALRNYRPGQGQQAPRVARVTLLGGHARLQHLMAACHGWTIGKGSNVPHAACVTAWVAADHSHPVSLDSTLSLRSAQRRATADEKRNIFLWGRDLQLATMCFTALAHVRLPTHCRSPGIAGRDGYQQLFDATLVGADRTKDLAVVRIAAPKVPFSLMTFRDVHLMLLVGTDRTKDLAVLHIVAPKVSTQVNLVSKIIAAS